MVRKSFTVAVDRKERETTGSLLRRFGQYIQKSRVLRDARDRRFYSSKPSRAMRRRSALRRSVDRVKYEKLRKMGKIK